MDYGWMKLVEQKLDKILKILSDESNTEEDDFEVEQDDEEDVKGELEAELDQDDDVEDIDDIENPEEEKLKKIEQLKKKHKMPPRTADFEDDGLPSLDELDD